MRQTIQSRQGIEPVYADVLFLLGYALSYLFILAVLRGMLLYANIDLAENTPVVDLVRSFLVGARFDFMITSMLAAPLLPWLLFPGGLGKRKLAIIWLASAGAITLFVGAVEPEFYREFHTRLNSIAFHYIQEDPVTVSSMIWNGFPVVSYLLLWLGLCILFVSLLVRINRMTMKQQPCTANRPVTRVVVFTLILFLTVWGGRGTLRSGPPLRWGDAFHSEHVFANHLALNGTYTLGKAAIATSGSKSSDYWLDAMPSGTALEITRNMLMVPGDTALDAGIYPVLRHHQPDVRLAQPLKNVVLVIMESFSGEFTGVLGNNSGITPEFDKLAGQGLLFDRFFSNGTHTHQGMFATVACFPNLPGYEYLMQQPEGQNRFSGLPAILKPAGFNDLYVYNGDFSWDNQKGFFRNQGMMNFVGRDDYSDPVFVDPTWGVSDEDMFNRALEELNILDRNQPFFAVLQTLSNHTPYALPDDLPVEQVSGFGKLNQHLTAQRYSDWALGQFFAKAESQPWYDETLFIVVGDHGFPVSKQLSDIDLLRFRVPFLMLAPGIQETYGALNHIVSTQVDIVPTAVSLLGKPFTHQCWGRDLLSLPDDDPGIGMIKPSGNDATVALIKGNTVIIKSPNAVPVLGQYSLSPISLYRPIEDKNTTVLMSKELTAYIQTALQSLLDNRTGLP